MKAYQSDWRDRWQCLCLWLKRHVNTAAKGFDDCMRHLFLKNQDIHLIENRQAEIVHVRCAITSVDLLINLMYGRAQLCCYIHARSLFVDRYALQLLSNVRATYAQWNTYLAPATTLSKAPGVSRSASSSDNNPGKASPSFLSGSNLLDFKSRTVPTTLKPFPSSCLISSVATNPAVHHHHHLHCIHIKGVSSQTSWQEQLQAL